MEKVRNFIVCFSVLILSSMQASAQGFDREAFTAKRNAYITEQIGLTATEASVFIPLDNELMQKKFEVGRECHNLERELKKQDSKSEEKYNELLRCREDVKEKRDRLDKEYLEKFKKVLSAEQIVKYQSANRAFFDEFVRTRK